MSDEVFILTAKIEKNAHEFFDALRKKYFPLKRNYLSAHLTLFHALPAARLEQITDEIFKAAKEAPYPAKIEAPYQLGRGVAYRISSEKLTSVRKRWRDAWQDFLTKQDSAKNDLHITIQNKVSPDQAKSTLALVSQLATPDPLHIVGYELYIYEGGPWRWKQSWNLNAT